MSPIMTYPAFPVSVEQKNLQLHMVTHSPTQLQCPDCERSFRRFASLRSHLTVHEVEEAIVCPQCQQDFPTQVGGAGGGTARRSVSGDGVWMECGA